MLGTFVIYSVLKLFCKQVLLHSTEKEYAKFETVESQCYLIIFLWGFYFLSEI